MRRHLIGLGLCVVMFIAMFFGAAWGYLRLLRLPSAAGAPPSALPAQGGSLLSSGSVVTALAAVAATGLIAGILIAWPRVSPLATGLPGLVALAWTGLYLASVKDAVNLIPLRGHAFGAGWEALLFNGILGLAGLAMIIPMFLPARWRDPYAAEAEEIEADVSDTRDYVAGLKATLGADSVGSSARNAAGLPDTRSAGAAGRPGPEAAGPSATAPRHRRSAGQPGQPGQAGQPGQLGQPGRVRPTQTPGSVLTGRTIPPSGQRMTGAQARLTGEQARLAAAQQRLTGGQQRLTGGQPVVPGGQSRLTGGQPVIPGGQQRPTGAQQRPTGGYRWPTGAQQRLPDEPESR